MSASDSDQEKARLEQELRIQRQIAFASGLFQGDVTVRTLLESLAEGVVIIDNSGTILLVNTRAEQMFGYPKRELIGKPHAILVPERFRKGHEEHEAGYFKEPRIRPMGQLLDLAGRRRDGSEFPLDISLGFIETINGVLVLAFVSDITLRKQYESNLREIQQRFATFMGHLPAAAWMKDLHGRYVYANAEAERIFSRPLSSLLGKTDGEVFPTETARQFVENDRQVLAGGGSLRTTEVLRQSDGIEHHSIVSKFAVPGPDGRPACVAGVAFDITELKRAEEALRESEEKFSKIFDTAPVGITISNLADGRFVEINREGERLSGYRRDEVIGRTALEFNIWKDPAERARMIEDVQKEGVVRDREMTFRDKEGNVLLGLFSAVVIDIGQKKRLLSLVSDITERKRAEEALRFSEARYRALFRDNPTMIFTLDTEWTVLSTNPFGASQLGFTIDELEGQSVLKIFYEDDRPALAEQLLRC
ncbi:MAG TPA: PAS domain S-box protein, partial [Geobacteraceae bacterium]|nr:PAS domain S-box protein [Geobacteraceae bacterium]